MRRSVSARWVTVKVEMFARTASDGAATAMNVPVGAVMAARGNSGQRALNAGVSDGWPASIMQWCAPLRRQQAGRCASMFCPIASSGTTVGRPKTASSNHVRTRRMCEEFSRNDSAIRRSVSDLRCPNLVRLVLKKCIELEAQSSAKLNASWIAYCRCLTKG